MKINVVKNAEKVGKFEKNDKNNNLIKFKKLNDFSEQKYIEDIPRVYLFVVNNEIKKIGGSASKGGIKTTIAFYENAKQGSPGPVRFIIHELIAEELNNKKNVEVYMITSPKVKANVNGLFDTEEIEIASFKEMEDKCKLDYLLYQMETLYNYYKYITCLSIKEFKKEVPEKFREYLTILKENNLMNLINDDLERIYETLENYNHLKEDYSKIKENLEELQNENVEEIKKIINNNKNKLINIQVKKDDTIENIINKIEKKYIEAIQNPKKYFINEITNINNIYLSYTYKDEINDLIKKILGIEKIDITNILDESDENNIKSLKENLEKLIEKFNTLNKENEKKIKKKLESIKKEIKKINNINTTNIKKKLFNYFLEIIEIYKELLIQQNEDNKDKIETIEKIISNKILLYPDWNFQENNQSYPAVNYQNYLNYHKKRTGNK
ncbi:GIY-YIG nuclease family protein [Nautilia lithotrophica]